MIKKSIKWIFNQIRAIALTGNQRICSICGRNYKRFLSFGVQKRANAQCPGCGSLERHRMIWMFGQEQGLFDKPIKLLHVSPESVLFKYFRQNAKIDYVAIDKFDPGYDYPKETHKADITKLPFPDDGFDGIICIHVLEHVPDDALAMSELFRVLKPGGWAIIQSPIDYELGKTFEDFSITEPAMRAKAFGQPDHVRWYGMDYKNRLTTAGFEVDIINFNSRFSEDERLKLGLVDKDDIYYCHKNGHQAT
jgi:SAM-dependent methyltransferase